MQTIHLRLAPRSCRFVSSLAKTQAATIFISQRSRVCLGVTKPFVDYFDDEANGNFAWGGSLANSDSEKLNPWQLLGSQTVHSGRETDPIPVVLDKNTANYSLKIYMLDTIKEVNYDTGESIHFRVVGFLANTILQGSLIMSEQDFENAFPTSAGYQYFLVKDGDKVVGGSSNVSGSHTGVTESSANVAILEDRLGDQGFDARSAPKLLSSFMAGSEYLSQHFSNTRCTRSVARNVWISGGSSKKRVGATKGIGFDASRRVPATQVGIDGIDGERVAAIDGTGGGNRGSAVHDGGGGSTLVRWYGVSALVGAGNDVCRDRRRGACRWLAGVANHFQDADAGVAAVLTRYVTQYGFRGSPWPP